MRSLLIRLLALSLAVVALASVLPSKASPYPDMEVEAGPALGATHWWRWETLRGKDYYEDPPTLADIQDNGDGTYSMPGEAPISITLVLHPEFFPDNPWRKAIDWVRQAETYYRNSGVSVRFLVQSIHTYGDMPDFKEQAYNYMRVRAGELAEETGADMVAVLMPHYISDPYCGVATIGTRNKGYLSVSGCSPKPNRVRYGAALPEPEGCPSSCRLKRRNCR